MCVYIICVSVYMYLLGPEEAGRGARPASPGGEDNKIVAINTNSY